MLNVAAAKQVISASNEHSSFGSPKCHATQQERAHNDDNRICKHRARIVSKREQTLQSELTGKEVSLEHSEGVQLKLWTVELCACSSKKKQLDDCITSQQQEQAREQTLAESVPFTIDWAEIAQQSQEEVQPQHHHHNHHFRSKSCKCHGLDWIGFKHSVSDDIAAITAIMCMS